MATETMTLQLRVSKWLMPVLWSLFPVFVIVGEATRRKIIAHIATRAIHVR